MEGKHRLTSCYWVNGKHDTQLCLSAAHLLQGWNTPGKPTQKLVRIVVKALVAQPLPFHQPPHSSNRTHTTIQLDSGRNLCCILFFSTWRRELNFSFTKHPFRAPITIQNPLRNMAQKIGMALKWSPKTILLHVARFATHYTNYCYCRTTVLRYSILLLTRSKGKGSNQNG